MLKAYSPDGSAIVGTYELIPGMAQAEVTRDDSGAVNVEYLGETEVYWNDQKTVRDSETNQTIYVDENESTWRESELVWK